MSDRRPAANRLLPRPAGLRARASRPASLTGVGRRGRRTTLGASPGGRSGGDAATPPALAGAAWAPAHTSPPRGRTGRTLAGARPALAHTPRPGHNALG